MNAPKYHCMYNATHNQTKIIATKKKPQKTDENHTTWINFWQVDLNWDSHTHISDTTFYTDNILSTRSASHFCCTCYMCSLYLHYKIAQGKQRENNDENKAVFIQRTIPFKHRHII